MSQRDMKSCKHHRIKPQNTQRARELRRDAPIPERILWGIIRSGRLGGFKFRRQHVVGPFVVDFYCPQAKLVVELDGLSHVGRGNADDKRTIFLEQRGLKVIRVTNDDALHHLDAVADYILRQAET